MAQAKKDIGFEYVRFHGILDRDMSVMLDDCKTTSFYNVDTVYDYILSIGMRPVVELSFVPDCMASGPADIFHYGGDGYPPKDNAQWAQFIHDTIQHWYQRYGAAELYNWWFEVFNEPNCGFFHGTELQYYQMYNYTANAIKKVDPKLLAGGPATCQCDWVPAFTTFCAKNNVPYDFVSTHLYPTDPNVPTHDRFGFATVIAKAAAQAGSKPLLLTEFNAGLGINTLDRPYAASFVWHNVPLLAKVSNLPLWSYWQATGIFEEGGQNSVPFDSNDFGIQTVHGVAKPVYRGMQLLNYASETAFSSVTQTPSIQASQITSFSALSRDGKSALVYVTNFDVIENANLMSTIPVSVSATSAKGFSNVGTTVAVWCVDDKHSNARAAWEAMGSPMYPTRSQIAQLKAASELVVQNVAVTSKTATSVSVDLQLLPWASCMVVIPL
jgi:xylan 1,4-beta-xylosidase